MTISEFLEHWGIVENPFCGEEAWHDAVFVRMTLGQPPTLPAPGQPIVIPSAVDADARDSSRPLPAVRHSDFEKILGNPATPASAIVFGDKGSGKTAIRLQLAERIAAYNAAHPGARVLLIPYDDLNAMLDGFRRRSDERDPLAVLKKFRLLDHIDAILLHVVPRLTDALLASRPGPATTDASAPGVSSPRDPDALDLGPDPLRVARAMPPQWRRDLLLLQVVYDRPEHASRRSVRLRRRLRLTPLWRQWLAGILAWTGWVPAAALFVWRWRMGDTLRLDGPWSLAIMALGGLWVLFVLRHLLWDHVARIRLGARLRRQIRVHSRPDASYARALRVLDPPLRDATHLPLTDSDESRYSMLARLKRALRPFGYAGILVVADRVDEPTLIAGDPERMRAFVWPMLNNKFLQQDGFAVKLLLPSELRHALLKESFAFFQEARLDKQNLIERLAWTGPNLYDLCNARLQACLAPGARATLLDLFADDVAPRDLMSALEQMQQPRDAFKFLYACISEHCAGVSAAQNQWKIPRLVMDNVRRAHAERVQQLQRGVRPA